MLQTESEFSDSFSDLAPEPCATEEGSSSACLPERALLRAVLQEAIMDVRGYATGVSQKNRRRAAQQAYYWILSRDMTWPFSFENICTVLGFDADCMRQWLLREPAAPAAVVQATPANSVRGGGMVRAVRAARMRGNQQKQVLRLRRRGSASGERKRTTTPIWSETAL